jgi:hypothetical protein
MKEQLLLNRMLSMINLKNILLFVATCTFLFNSCATHSKEILVYEGKTDLELGDSCTMGGRILERNSKKPLIGANIIIIGTSCAAGTDKSGSYLIEKIPPGVYIIKVSYIGFQSLELSNFNFEKGEYYLVDFELLESEPSFHQD